MWKGSGFLSHCGAAYAITCLFQPVRLDGAQTQSQIFQKNIFLVYRKYNIDYTVHMQEV